LASVRLDDWKYVFRRQPEGWFGPKSSARLAAAFSIFGSTRSSAAGSTIARRRGWQFVYVQQEIAQTGERFVQFSPMQEPASLDLENVRDQILAAIGAPHGGKIYRPGD
jgi:hypothetical protein